MGRRSWIQSKLYLSSKRRMSPYNSHSSSGLVDEMVNWSDPSEIAKDSGELSGFKPRHLVGFRLTFWRRCHSKSRILFIWGVCLGAVDDLGF